MKLVDHVAAHAQSLADKVAVRTADQSLTYAELWVRVEERAAELRERGDGFLVFRAAQDADFLISYLAAHRAGIVAVPLERDAPQEVFDATMQKMQAAMLPEGIADVLFTTGTTGQSKGVMISHDTILAEAENLIAGQGFRPDLTFIVAGPLNHIGSLSKLYPMFLLGGTVVITEGLKDINAFYDAIEKAEGKVATFLVPSNIRMLLKMSMPRLRSLAEKIDFIETGAAPLSSDDMQALCGALPQSRLYNTYASTETGIIATYNYNEGGPVQGCLGKTMPNSKIEISDKGYIVCRGRTLMAGYLGDPELTASVLHDGAVHTHDLGEIDSDGNLHLLGRAGDVINVGGYKVSPSEVEDAALSFPGIRDCICLPAPHPILGTALKLLVLAQDEKAKPGFREIAQYLKTRLESYKVPTCFEYVDRIERTYNGKLNRKAYLPCGAP